MPNGVPWANDDSDRRRTTATGPAEPGMYSMAMGSGRNESWPNQCRLRHFGRILLEIIRRNRNGNREDGSLDGRTTLLQAMYMKLLHVRSTRPQSLPAFFERCWVGSGVKGDVAIRLQLMSGVQLSRVATLHTRYEMSGDESGGRRSDSDRLRG